MSRFLEIAKFARENSEYYSKLYKDVPLDCDDESLYPMVEQETFWKANENFGEGVLTSKHQDGVVFKSGGTSGNPKYSYFTAQEWKSFTDVSGEGFRHNGIKRGDKIANLFYAGQLYASFIYITDSIQSSGVGINYPMSGQMEIEEMVKMLHKLKINVIAGVPSTIMSIVSYLQEHPEMKLNIDLILFGGESFYDDQLQEIGKCFKGVRVNSILYASVDGGELGYFDAISCENGEHRVFDQSTIMEIVDEDSGALITEENVLGKLVVTNLNRKLMPLVRYPVGDLAVWREPQGSKNRKFKLQGRAQEGARVGPATLYVQDVLSLFEEFNKDVQVLNFQVVITHEEGIDRCVINAVSSQTLKHSEALAQRIVSRLYEQRTMLQDLLDGNLIHPISLKWCRADEIECNPRTGKTKKILDCRFR